jgi:hypothetical protein
MGVALGVPEDCRLVEVPQTNGKYWAGSDGHIYCHSNSRRAAKLPKPFRVAEFLGSRGYLFVSIILDGQRHNWQVHSVICRGFHGSKPSRNHCVRHKNGKPTDNVPSNVAWGTYFENAADTIRHGTNARGSRHGHAKMTDEGVRLIRSAISAGDMTTRQAATLFGMHQASIRHIVNGRSWKHVL